MRLSEAIRLGSMLRPQNTDGKMTDGQATCAIGAALDACGTLDLEDQGEGNYVSAKETWPLFLLSVEGPVNGAVSELFEIVIELNDVYEWTRERIADWVESIEQRSEAPQTVDAVVAPVPLTTTV